MKDEILFSIDKLVCSYNRNADNKVLFIDKMEIPRGKLVFLLGASGCGKSTLLETLGLMNNTVVGGDIFLHTFDDRDTINIPGLWQKDKIQQLTSVRKKYYSFIFQNTNLMENFTAYENVCLSGMIKENVIQSAVLPEAQILMSKIKLPETEVNLNTLAVNLSGGQRQRLAFARALNNKATILFGDEPTGNLDEANANELFEIIKENKNKSVSAIIVSHDIDLAIKYADQIIVITKETGKNYGEVKPENIFNRESWQNFEDAQLTGFQQKLRGLYQVANEKKVNTKVETTKAKTDTSISYPKLFLRKEGNELVGKRKGNLLILSIILFFTFLAIGFANGSLYYLNKQLNDGFVNWVTVTVPKSRSVSGEFRDLLDELNSKEKTTHYKYSNATPYKRPALSVYDFGSKSFNFEMTRSIDVNDDAKLLNDYILNKKNIIRSKIARGFKNENDIAVIVTEKFLEAFSYPPDAKFIYCSLRRKDSLNNVKDILVPIQIRTVVDRLPEKCGIIYPLFFYQAFMTNNDEKESAVFDSTTRTFNCNIFLETADSKKASSFKNDIESFFASAAEYKPYYILGNISQTVDTISYMAGYNFAISFDSAINNPGLLNSLASKIKSHSKDIVDTNKVMRVFDYGSVSPNKADIRFDNISVNFNELDSVRAFADYLKKRGDAKRNTEVIEVDETKVKEKENFFFLSTVTKTVSVLLVIFSTLAVCLFIFNLLKSHLSKVKMNIGTFKAIGLKDKEARNIYFRIILLFASASLIVAFLVAALIGTVANGLLVGKADALNGISYFKILDLSDASSLVNIITIGTITIILASTLIMSWLTIRKILSKTPGDLIYNR